MMGFLITVAGAAAAWHYRKEIRDFVDKEWPTVRDRTAEGRRVVENRAEDLLDKVTELRKRYRGDPARGQGTRGSRQSRG